MTTVEQRITQIEQQAKARGLTARPTARLPGQRTAARPTGPAPPPDTLAGRILAATRSKLPDAAAKHWQRARV